MTGNEIAGPRSGYIDADGEAWGHPRVMTFTLPEALPAGAELLFTIFAHGEVEVAVRERADHSIVWSPPLNPTHDSATPRGLRA